MANETTFLGYLSNNKTYRVVEELIHVVFDETNS